MTSAAVIDFEAAHIAYTAYGETVRWRAVNGDRMPAFADLPERIQLAWIKAARAVRVHMEDRQ